MKFFRLLVPAIALLFLAGCFQISTVVHVNPDGSGTVEETMLLSKKFFAQITEMMQGMGGESKTKPEPPNLFEPEKLAAQAGAMGEGVTYRAGKKVENADFTGYTVSYSFTDINKLKLSQQSDSLGSPAGGGKPSSLPITFHMTKGPTATLTIDQPKPKQAEPPAAPETAKASDTAPQAVSDEEGKFISNLFMGMKFLLAVEVNGSIVSTNASYRDGTRVTLVDMDMGKLGSALPHMEKLSRLQGSSFEDAKEALKDFPGMKVELNDKLTVVFR